jgi:hypothetical protein
VNRNKDFLRAPIHPGLESSAEIRILTVFPEHGSISNGAYGLRNTIVEIYGNKIY